ncbi:hypothetical protein ACFQ6N_12750 [Kitasatospora sp. NPDC056446]|uniref:hypothetical protein n=1 Tax=Kitasatospora sp. NPDC056446 TaxID=3345819 RepID=UPI00367C2F4A
MPSGIRVDGATRTDVEAAFLAAVRGGRPQPGPERVGRVPDGELRAVTGRLLRLRGECGCRAGAWSMTGALVVSVVLAVLRGASGLWGVAASAGVCLVGTVTVSVLGKGVAVAVARVRWRRARDRVLRSLAEEEAADVALR